MAIELEAMLAVATNAARAASDLLRGAHASTVRSKASPRDLVTEWDLRAEQTIRDVLEPAGYPILGEEGGQTGAPGEPGGARYRWLVDPIDGTVNFAHGLPIWSIAIALEEVGQGPLVGVVAAPAIGWWFQATRGAGAFDGNGTRLSVSACTQLDQALLATGFPYDIPTNTNNNLAEWAHMQKTAGSCRRLGVASIDLCAVASGWFDGYWERRLSPWDIAAGALIVVEAGGKVTNPTGGTFDAHSGEVIASNGAIHEGLVTELGRVRT
jgi:myo-inositol-1(or 4)-monophosphatase